MLCVIQIDEAMSLATKVVPAVCVMKSTDPFVKYVTLLRGVKVSVNLLDLVFSLRRESWPFLLFNFMTKSGGQSPNP